LTAAESEVYVTAHQQSTDFATIIIVNNIIHSCLK